MAFLKAPRIVISVIENTIRPFLWKGNMDIKKKITLISLKSICSNKSTGGDGVHSLIARNFSLGTKLVWHMYAKSSTSWCKILQAKYLDYNSPSRISTIENPPFGSVMWNFLVSRRS